MKHSTKLYLQAAFEVICIPLIFISLMPIAKLLALDFGSRFQNLMNALLTVSFFKGIKTFINATLVCEPETEKLGPTHNTIFTDAKNRKLFRKLIIKKLDSIGVSKEIYRTSSFSLLLFCNLFYLLCPYYSIANDEPFGIILNAENARKFVDNDELLPFFINEIDDATFLKTTVSLKKSNFLNLAKYCVEHAPSLPTDFINPKFQGELIHDTINNISIKLIPYLPAVCFVVTVVSGLIGFFVCAASLIIGIKSILYARKKSIKPDTKAIICIILSAMFLLVTL